MTTHRSVWAVTSGSYSSYSILCICDTEARAEAIAKRAGTDFYVEEMPYVDRNPKRITVHYLTCYFSGDGRVSEQYESTEAMWDFTETGHTANTIAEWRPGRNAYNAPITNGTLRVGGPDLEAVRHVFSDTRAQLMIDGAWRTTGTFERGGRKVNP